PSYSGAKPFFRPLYNAGAYILTLNGAKKLLPFTNPIRMGADTVPNKARFKTSFKLFGYVPLLVKQNDIFRSSTVDWDKVEDKEKYKGKYYMV
ncbi:MAG: hypothetical protein JWQ09_3897, partial [Segetibacter sp.]|nr:hypothetical protein [Segetibacter sp.]